MVLRRFDECLNDLVEYFILADIAVLLDFAANAGLGEDLATPFMTTEIGDEAVAHGAVVPVFGVENHPYTIVLACDEPPWLTGPRHALQHERAGYALEVRSGCIHLFTLPFLRHTPHLRALAGGDLRYAHRPRLAVPNGCYSVTVRAGICGEPDERGDCYPAFELALRTEPTLPRATADIAHRFAVEWDYSGRPPRGTATTNGEG